MEAKGPRENNVLDAGGKREGVNGTDARGERGKGWRRMERGGVQRVEKEAMKRLRDKKKVGEGRRGRRNDGREMVEKGEETKRGRERERVEIEEEDRVGRRMRAAEEGRGSKTRRASSSTPRMAEG